MLRSRSLSSSPGASVSAGGGGWQGVPDDVPGMGAVEHTSSVLTIAAVTWLAAASLQGLADAMVVLHPADIADNLQARRIQTQTRVLVRIAIGAVLIAGLAFALGPRTELVTEFLAPMLWVTNNQTLLSMNLSLELAFRL